MRGARLFPWVILMTVACAAAPPEPERYEPTGKDPAHAARPMLDGPWDFRPVKGKTLGSAPPDDSWLNQAIRVPGFWADRDAADLHGYPNGWQQDNAAWYRTAFDGPAVPKNHRLVLEFESVDYQAAVFVNGTRVGDHAGSFTPFAVDVTSAVREGADNSLVVGVVNWSAAIAGDTLGSDLKRLTRLTPARLTAPVGILDNPIVPNDGGISGHVRLVVRPDAFVQSVAIRTSVRRKTLDADVVIGNDADVDRTVIVTGHVLDGGRAVLSLPDARVQVPAGGTTSVTLSRPWTNPILWEPGTPHLYQLVTTASTSADARDEHVERFGFRECWIAGRDFILNGKKVVLRGTTDGYHFFFFSNRLADSVGPGATTPGAVRVGARDSFARLRRINVNTVRLPVPARAQLDIADETGLLVVDESMVSGVLNEIPAGDGAFWEASRAQVRDWVIHDRNHPSVVIWSVENEVLRNRHGDTRFVGSLLDLARAVRALDPTRPLMFEGDGDPGGLADLINLHYPEATPPAPCSMRFAGTLPIALDSFPATLAAWTKPLYIGEFGWSLDRGFYTPVEYPQFIREYPEQRNRGHRPVRHA